MSKREYETILADEGLPTRHASTLNAVARHFDLAPDDVRAALWMKFNAPRAKNFNTVLSRISSLLAHRGWFDKRLVDLVGSYTLKCVRSTIESTGSKLNKAGRTELHRLAVEAVAACEGQNEELMEQLIEAILVAQ